MADMAAAMAPQLPSSAPRLPSPQSSAIPSGPTAPVAMPTQNMGLRAKGMTLVSIAVKALEQAVPMIGVTSKEGTALLDAVKKLSGMFPQPSPAITSQELKTLDAQAPAIPPAPQEAASARIAQLGLGQPAAA